MNLRDTVQQTLDGRAYALTRLSEAAGDLAVNLLVALVILVFTIWAAGLVARIVRRGMSQLPATRDDETLQGFASSMARYAAYLIGAVAVLHRLGVETTSIITVLGAASLAVGLALQGALSNVAAGVMILIFRPYRVGDFVTIAGKSGTVKKLDLFNTELVDVDGLKIVAPNGKGFSDVVVNYTDIPVRRIEISVLIRQSDDVELALKVLKDTAAKEPRLRPEPPIWAKVTDLGPSGATATLRVWADLPQFWEIRSDLLLALKLALQGAGLSPAYPVQLIGPVPDHR